MYDAVADPYCYPGTTVLKNIPDIRNQAKLGAFEAAMTARRADEPLPAGHLSVSHYCAIHHHLFQDVYLWAGRSRTMRLFKDESAFCYPENIDREMQRLFADLKRRRYLRDRPAGDFAAAGSSFVATLNAIHAFREGNGRLAKTIRGWRIAEHHCSQKRIGRRRVHNKILGTAGGAPIACVRTSLGHSRR